MARTIKSKIGKDSESTIIIFTKQEAVQLVNDFVKMLSYHDGAGGHFVYVYDEQNIRSIMEFITE